MATSPLLYDDFEAKRKVIGLHETKSRDIDHKRDRALDSLSSQPPGAIILGFRVR